MLQATPKSLTHRASETYCARACLHARGSVHFLVTVRQRYRMLHRMQIETMTVKCLECTHPLERRRATLWITAPTCARMLTYTLPHHRRPQAGSHNRRPYPQWSLFHRVHTIVPDFRTLFVRHHPLTLACFSYWFWQIHPCLMQLPALFIFLVDLSGALLKLAIRLRDGIPNRVSRTRTLRGGGLAGHRALWLQARGPPDKRQRLQGSEPPTVRTLPSLRYMSAHVRM